MLEIDDDVIRGRVFVGPSVVLPNQTAGAIPPNRPAHLRGGGNSDPARALRWDDGHAYEGRGPAPPDFQNGCEFVTFPDPPVSAKSALAWEQGAFGPPSLVARLYAPRRCLPLARLLLITSLPPRVRMRTRKPCVLFLRRLLGWNVLITIFWILAKGRTRDVIGYCPYRQRRRCRPPVRVSGMLSLGSLAWRTSRPIRACFFEALWLIR